MRLVQQRASWLSVLVLGVCVATAALSPARAHGDACFGAPSLVTNETARAAVPFDPAGSIGPIKLGMTVAQITRVAGRPAVSDLGLVYRFRVQGLHVFVRFESGRATRLWANSNQLSFGGVRLAEGPDRLATVIPNIEIDVCGPGWDGDYTDTYLRDPRSDSRITWLKGGLPLVWMAPSDWQVDNDAMCNVRGRLPDEACTPGAVRPDATRALVCRSNDLRTVSRVSQHAKNVVAAQYGIYYAPLYKPPLPAFTPDHLIPVTLGGSNATANLWAMPHELIPGAQQKRALERHLHASVCAGRMTLRRAQRLIATDWVKAWRTLVLPRRS